MFNFKTVQLELHNARQARIAAELACCDIEELAAEIRQSHILWVQQEAVRRSSSPRLH
jgi:hypothetical protein